jgi:ketosteroid isomerase-like protein
VPSANLDLVRSIYAAWELGDWSSTDWADPEIEFVIADGPDPGTVTGLSAMGSGWRDFLTAWDDYRLQADEYRELDDERVLVLLHASGRGKTSGVELGLTNEQGANVLYITDGKVSTFVAYFDHRRALAELGVAPEAS